jgi:hypothetical protein
MNDARVRPLRWLRSFAAFLALLWLTHALGFMVHEYAHSFTAWALGCKANPLALNYGHLDWSNLLLQSDIDENVAYDPIFAAHRNLAAATIAMAGVLFGNGLLYLLSRFRYKRARQTGRRTPAMFWFLLITVNIGNFLSYVPIRTFANHADMATVVKALGISPWWIIAMPGLLFAAALLHYLAVLLPGAVRSLYPHRRAGQVMLLLVGCGLLFGFYGSAGFSGYGAAALALSRTCVWVLLPLSIVGAALRVKYLEAVHESAAPVFQ